MYTPYVLVSIVGDGLELKVCSVRGRGGGGDPKESAKMVDKFYNPKIDTNSLKPNGGGDYFDWLSARSMQAEGEIALIRGLSKETQSIFTEEENREKLRTVRPTNATWVRTQRLPSTSLESRTYQGEPPNEVTASQCEKIREWEAYFYFFFLYFIFIKKCILLCAFFFFFFSPILFFSALLDLFSL